MSDKEARALIIKNYAMFEDVYKESMDSIGPDICGEIAIIVKTFIEENHWEGGYSFWDDDELWFAPLSWKINENVGTDAFKAKYKFVFVTDNKTSEDTYGECCFYLSPFFGVGATQTSFCFAIERKYIGNPKATEWYNYCLNHPLYNKFKKGFTLTKDGNLFNPFRLDSEAVANAYDSGIFEDVLEPVKNSLKNIIENHTMFEQLLADAENKFKAQ